MCGVSAVYGENAALKAMLITLNQLERGTKGSGVAYMCNGELVVLKEPIHPVEFFDRYYSSIAVETNMAIAHNRLPSVGGVCYENTHPFVDCKGRFALAHNGHAFVNHVRDYLKRLGHIIQGQTDSEILTHLLEEYYDEHGDMLMAVKLLVENHLSGAIVVLTKDNEIYCAKSGGAPLNYAVDDNEVFVASSDMAIRLVCRMLGKKDYVLVRVDSDEVLRIDEDGCVDCFRAATNRRHKYYTIDYSTYYGDWRDYLSFL